MIRSPKDFRLAAGNLYRYPRNTADGVIYCRFTHTKDGRRRDVRRNTQKLTEGKARAVAWTIYQQETGLIAEELVPRAKRPTCPIGRIVDHYAEHRPDISKASESAAKSNVAALRRILQIVHPSGKSTAWRDLPCSQLDESTVHNWRRARYRAHGRNFADEREHDASLNASLNSELTQARSVFARGPMDAYRRAGYALGDGLTRFLAVPRLRADLEGFTAIPETIDARMQASAAAALGRAPGDPDGLSPAAAVCYELARFLAMTQGEIVHARLEWLSPSLDSLAIAAYTDEAGHRWTTKRGTKDRLMPVRPDRARSWLLALHNSKKHPGGTGYLIPWSTRGQCARELAHEQANAWIARHLPDRTKRLHELRKQSGLDVFRTTGSLSAAAAWIGDSEATARKYYLPKRHDAAALGAKAL